MSEHDLVYVEWFDHFSSDNMDWTNITKIEEEEMDPVLCRSVGWIVKENKRILRLCSHFDGDPGNDAEAGFAVMNIIKSAIVKRRKIKI